MLSKALLAILLALGMGIPTFAVVNPLVNQRPSGEAGNVNETAQVPVWTVGSSWTYALEARSEGPLSHAALGGNVTVSVASITAVAGNKTYVVDLDGKLSSRHAIEGREGRIGPMVKDAQLAGTFWIRAADLALEKEQIALTGTAQAGQGNVTFAFQVTNTFTPALPLLPFPLKVGKLVVVSTAVQSDGSAQVTFQGPMGTVRSAKSWSLNSTVTLGEAVVNIANLTTPAGTFRSFHVLSNRGMLERQHPGDEGMNDHDDDERGNETAEARENETSEARAVEGPEDVAAAAQSMAFGLSSQAHDRILHMGPASQAWYSPTVRNVVSFKAHLNLGMARVAFRGTLLSYHIA